MLLLRRCAALAAAYALALQLVLSAFAAVAPLALAAEAGFAICRGDDSNTPAGPAAHDPCSACLAHCSGTAAGPEREASPLAWPLGATSFVHSFTLAAAPSAATQTREHSPRAPPPG